MFNRLFLKTSKYHFLPLLHTLTFRADEHGDRLRWRAAKWGGDAEAIITSRGNATAPCNSSPGEQWKAHKQ
jgi:hypothetical protein